MSSQQPHKLLQFEVKPPVEMWAAIETELDQQAGLPTLEKMVSFEATPPEKVWQQIEKTISKNEQPEKIISFKRGGWIRYAAAAVILAIVAFGVITYGLQREDNELADQKNNVGLPIDHSNRTSVNASNDQKEQEKDKTLKQPSPSGSHSSAKQENTVSHSSTPAPSKRYLTVAMDNGEKVRLSKKVLPVFECADNATAIIRKRCKENIESLQQKMASTLASPTTDFAGLVDMIKTLEENQ